MQIINYMCQIVEDYIYAQKKQRVQINRLSILSSRRELDLLIDAYNFATTGSFNWK